MFPVIVHPRHHCRRRTWQVNPESLGEQSTWALTNISNSDAPSQMLDANHRQLKPLLERGRYESWGRFDFVQLTHVYDLLACSHYANFCLLRRLRKPKPSRLSLVSIFQMDLAHVLHPSFKVKMEPFTERPAGEEPMAHTAQFSELPRAGQKPSYIAWMDNQRERIPLTPCYWLRTTTSMEPPKKEEGRIIRGVFSNCPLTGH